MPDSGQAAGQQIELAVCLTKFGTPLSYANAAAFEAAGWLPVYRAAQTTQAITYTLSPHPDATLAAMGYHLVILALVNGVGPLLFRAPTGGSAAGWQASPPGYVMGAESTDLDTVYNTLLQSVGVASAASQVVTTDFTVVEDDSFIRTITVLETAITQWGFTAENLADGTLTLEAAARAPGNRVGQPNAWITVTPITATTGTNPVLRLSWIDYPSAITGVQDGMDYSSSDESEVATISYLYDVQMKGAKTFAVTGGNQVGHTYTLGGDQRQWFSVGGTFAIAGSTGNNGTYTCSALSYAAGTTTLTVVEAIPTTTFNGSAQITIKTTLANGSITALLQRDRS